MTRNALLLTLALGLPLVATACGGEEGDDTATLTPTPDDGTVNAPDAITYRDLSTHPGCSTAGLSYTAATIGDYSCAAKAYQTVDDSDAGAPIVLLVHGNSDTPSSWESYPAGDDTALPQLAERLVEGGFAAYAVDMRIDLVDDPQGNNETENAARNIDHGWGTPIVAHLIESTMKAWPNRRVSVVGFSLGSTVVRDALRKLHNESDINVWSQLEDVVLLAGANHGVSTYYLCGSNPTMRGQVTCEMGSRDAYSPTAFHIPLNGTDGIWETPCSDGDSAFGETGQCDGNAPYYTTVVMQDISDGTYQDLFVSEASAALNGANNNLIGLDDVDESGYFFDGLFKNHYGSARSEAALTLIMKRLGD